MNGLNCLNGDMNWTGRVVKHIGRLKIFKIKVTRRTYKQTYEQSYTEKNAGFG